MTAFRRPNIIPSTPRGVALAFLERLDGHRLVESWLGRKRARAVVRSLLFKAPRWSRRDRGRE